MDFLQGITETRKAELLGQLRALWTHGSSAIEGNTLTLGDTMFGLGYGLTVKGKPLKGLLRRSWKTTLNLVAEARKGRQA